MNAISFGLMIPVLPSLIRSFFGAASAASTAQAAYWQFIFGVTWGGMQFFSGPVLGMLSDRFGRRPVLLISILGLALDFLVMTFAPTLAWLLLGRVLNGATAASFSTANAYVADVSTPENRARNFGWMSSAFSVGFLLGPAAGGILTTHALHLGGFVLDGLRVPFLVAAVLCAINWFYGLLVLPESLPPERRIAAFDWRRANPLESLRLLRSHHDLLPLASINFLFQLAQQVLPNIFVLYTQLRYHWSLSFLGVTFFITGALGILVQSFVVGPVVKRIGERGAVIAGAAAGMAGFVIYALAPTGYDLLLRHAGLRADGADAAGPAGADDPARDGERAGPPAGRQPVHRRHRRDPRADHLPAELRLGAAQPAGRAGRAGVDRRGAAGAGVRAGAALRPPRGARRRRATGRLRKHRARFRAAARDAKSPRTASCRSDREGVVSETTQSRPAPSAAADRRRSASSTPPS